ESCAQVRIVTSMTEAGADCAAETLSRQVRDRLWRRMPPEQRRDNSKIADGVEPKRRRDPDPPDNDAAKRWTNRATDVEADAICGDCGLKIGFGNERRHDRLPRRSRQCSAYADQERKDEEVQRCRLPQRYDHSEDSGSHRRAC